MIIKSLATIILGILVGSITGLIPSLHINLLAPIIAPFLDSIAPVYIILFVISLAITHTFVDFIPSIYFGAPDEDTGLSTLPGHRFLIRGNAHYAIKLSVVGSLLGVAIIIIISPLLIYNLKTIYPLIQYFLGFFLLNISILLFMLEKERRIESLIFFILSGFLGISSLNLPVKNPLLPLLTGLFGSSTIIYSIKNKASVPKQSAAKFKIKKSLLARPAIATAIASPICSLFPGLGSSQAAIIGSSLFKKIKEEEFLILLGSINTLVMATSFFILTSIDRSRTGAAAIISSISNSISPFWFFLPITMSAIFSSILTLKVSNIISKKIHLFNYALASGAVLILISLIVVFFSGSLGLLIYVSSAALGLSSMQFNVRRGFLMGSLLIPVTLLYLPI